MRKEGFERKMALVLLLILTVCVYFLWSTNQSALSETDTGPIKSASQKMTIIKRAANQNMTFANPTPGRCPVCNKRVSHEDFATIRGQRYETCSADCAKDLKAHPGKYVKTTAR